MITLGINGEDYLYIRFSGNLWYSYKFNDFRNDLEPVRNEEFVEKLEKLHLKLEPTCAACGSSKKLNVHHKKPFHLYPELELDENNLVTLCMSKMECHLLIGHGSDFKCYNPYVESDIKILQSELSHFEEVAQLAKTARVKE